MILNYEFKNFMSFRDNVEFSMFAPKSKVKNRFPNNYTTIDEKSDVLKTAVIVGENAGGKSNFVRSLDYFQSFFKDTDNVKAYRNTINNNNVDSCVKESDTLQCFDIEVFIKESGFYQYHLNVDHAGVVEESLEFKEKFSQSYRPVLFVKRVACTTECKVDKEQCDKKNCVTKIDVEYKIKEFGFETKLKESLEKAANSNKPLGLTVSKLALLGNDYAASFIEWIKDTLCPETNIINYDIYKTMKREEEDLRILNDPRYLEIFKMIDYSIDSFELDEEQPFYKTLIVRKKCDGSTFVREIGQDSSGVREFFAWAVLIFKVVYENKVVFADEMDRVLNPVLSDRIVSFILGKKHYGQFIMTSHNVLHLNLKNYMKEQIYFITKNADTLESELYSLADFSEIRYETAKIYEFYMKGILGGTSVE